MTRKLPGTRFCAFITAGVGEQTMELEGATAKQSSLYHLRHTIKHHVAVFSFVLLRFVVEPLQDPPLCSSTLNPHQNDQGRKGLFSKAYCSKMS